MTGMVGSDLEQMRTLAAAFDRAAGQLNQTGRRVRDGIQVSAWIGPFAVRFRQTWDSEHSVKLQRASTALSAQARQLRQEADQQEATSSAGTASGHAGGRVSDRDLVDFAESGTSNKSGISQDGFTMLSDSELRELGIDSESLHDAKTGFDAKVYRDASGRIIVSFGGTEDMTDKWTDLVGAVHPWGESNQANASVTLALALKHSVGADNLIFTGHSLGGRNAAIASLATGARAVTFNAAGVGAADYLNASTVGGNPPSKLEYVAGIMDIQSAAPYVTNYTTRSDPLTVGQALTPVPDAVGEQHVVESDKRGMEAHNDFDALRLGIPDED